MRKGVKAITPHSRLVLSRVDEALVDVEVVRLTGEKNRGKAVNRALAEFVRRQHVEELRASLGRWNLELDDWYEFRHGVW